jgi:NTE family protein
LSIALAARGLARRRPVVALAGALPPGLLDPVIVAQRIRELHGPTWPERATWICAVSVDTGRRVVFGRDDRPIDEIGPAVGASVAVPGYFAPMTIGGVDFVDGGTHSVTNADLVARAGFDVVVVSAPMTSAGTRWTRGRIGRSWHTRTLDAELAEIPAEVAMLVARPNTAIIERVGSDTMSAELEPDVAEMAFEMMARDLEGGRYDPALERLEASLSVDSEAGAS